MLIRPGTIMSPIRAAGGDVPPDPGDEDAILLEDGGQMLGEDGAAILLEAADPPDPPDGEVLLTEGGDEIHTEAGEPIAQET